MEEEQNRPFNVDEQLAERKMDRWGSNDNFVAPRELTLTITLSEYRRLIEENSRLSANNSQLRETADFRQKEIDQRDAHIIELENQVAELNEKLKARKTI